MFDTTPSGWRGATGRIGLRYSHAAQLHEWSPFTADRELSTVGDAILTMIDGDNSEELPASVSCADPPTLLEYTWGPDLLRWELVAINVGTRLTLLHTIEDREWVPKVAAGWHLCLVVAEHLLDGQPIGPHPRDGRDELWLG